MDLDVICGGEDFISWDLTKIKSQQSRAYTWAFVGLFVLMLNVPVNNFSVMSLPGYYQYFSGSKCIFAQGHNTVEVGIEPPTSRSCVRDSTTSQPRSPIPRLCKWKNLPNWLQMIGT